jgi:AP endonuclease-1
VSTTFEDPWDPSNMLRTTFINRIATMSRRSSHKSNAKVLEAHTTSIIASSTTTPRKGRKVVKSENEVLIVNAKPAKPSRTPKIKTEIYSEEDECATTVSKITSSKGKADLEPRQGSRPKKVSAKRKVKTEDEEEGEEKVIVTKKKRKTKEEKEAENVPLAERTLIVTLKKSMHIGAHVSGAKGMFEYLDHLVWMTVNGLLYASIRRAKLCNKCSSYWW